MNLERTIAMRMWPQHAEMCSEEDWTVISAAVEEDQPLTKSVIEPLGEARDMMLASLMILYCTMKIAHLALQIAKEVSNLKGREKTEAIVAAVATRIDEGTPKIVYDRINEIVGALGHLE